MLNNRTNVPSNPEEFFTKIYKHIEGADGFYSPLTGEAISLTPADKLVYSYMLDKQTAFAVGTGGVHFESQPTIANNLRISSKTVYRSLSKFKDHGVIVATQIKSSDKGYTHLQYTGVKHPLNTYRKIKGVITPLVIVKNTPKPRQQPTVAKPVYVPVFDDMEDDSLPF